jgi:hypothetical protein
MKWSVERLAGLAVAGLGRAVASKVAGAAAVSRPAALAAAVELIKPADALELVV